LALFQVLPEDFFSPLASPNRADYAACLLIFYRLFQETPGGVERSALVSRFAEYLAETGRVFQAESDGIGAAADPKGDDRGSESADSSGAADAAADSSADSADADADGDSDADAAAADSLGADPADADGNGAATEPRDAIRASASYILRRLSAYGWLGEEVLPDYTRLVTIAGYAKPFFDALASVESGSMLEYESHIVAIYSSLCGDAAKEHGHHAVLNAHYHLSLLIDSLKVLSQNIRTHYERLLEETAGAEVAEILHLHYDRYLEEVVDRAYARLKTSDNLSKYRPRITKTVNNFLGDKSWMSSTSAALALLRRESADAARLRLKAMLEDIRDQLRSLDPTLDEIDRRNMIYARSSLDRIRSRLRSDATLAGRITEIVRAVAANPAFARRLPLGLYRARWLGAESRYRRWTRESSIPVLAARPASDRAALEKAEAELLLRIAKQLTPERIADWLEERMEGETFGWAHELAVDQECFVRILHATAYGEAHRARFPFRVEWAEEEVEAQGWIFRKHGYRRRS
jgi:hypothetical protein